MYKITSSESNKIKTNSKTWNKIWDLFINGSALPIWGPFSVGKGLNLIPKTKGKTFLEIGCGSGRSIKYLTKRGAKKVYGLDNSSNQIAEAANYNKKEIDKGLVELFRAPMEEKISIKPVDVVFSIYGIGWTQNPKLTFSNIYSYLKPGGLFIWSWDHSFFTDVQYKNKKFVVIYSYHDEKVLNLTDWRKRGCRIYTSYKKVSTWFKLLREAGFQIENYFEPEPIDLARAHNDPTEHYSIQKARLVPSSFIFVCKKS